MPESHTYSKPEILAQITRLGLRAQRLVEGAISGLHRSPLHGVSVEFADYREYTPGDDLKRLDWRAYARSGKYFIRRYEEESNLRCSIVLDASRSMGYGSRAQGEGPRAQQSKNDAPSGTSPTSSPASSPSSSAGPLALGPGPYSLSKFDTAATLAASMATLCLRQRDAVGLALVDQAQRAFIRPSATQSQLARIIDTLEGSQPDRATDLGSALSAVCEQIPSRGIVLIISDFLTPPEPLYAALGRLQYSGHEVLLFQVLHDDEMDFPFNDSVMFKDIEGAEEIMAEPWAFRKAYQQAIREFIEALATRARFAGMDHHLFRTGDDLAGSLSRYLHERLRKAAGNRSGKIARR